MRSFKRVLAAIVCFCVCLLFFSWLLITAFFRYSDDSPARRVLAGSLDTIICGTSTAERALIPDVLDGIAGTSSYNLCSIWQRLDGTETLLRRELERNPGVKTVILAVSDNTLCDLSGGSTHLGNLYIVSRLGSWPERAAWLKEDPERSPLAIALSGMYYGFQRFSGLWNGNENRRGYFATTAVDVHLSADEARTTRASRTLDLDWPQKNIDQLTSIRDLCAENGARLLVAVMPFSDAMLWQYTGWDDFRTQLTELCASLDISMVDFNLYRDRGSMFNDKKSYSDESHLCAAGAEVFTPVFAEMLPGLLSGEDLSAQFYGDYEEMLRDSIYTRALTE